MKLFTCDDHDGVWLSGVSIILANDEATARKMLDAELAKRGLDEGGYELTEVPMDVSQVVMLFDGDY